MIKKALCCAVVGLFVFGLLAGFGSAENAKPVIQKSQLAPSPKEYTTHGPIRINNDAEFDNYALNRTIWGLEINGTGYGYCIYIGNCSQPFMIKDCYLHNASGKPNYYCWNTGLCIYKSSNGTLSNNLCNGNTEGIYLIYGSDYTTLTNNNCSGNLEDGIRMDASNSNTLTNNNCSGNKEYGIYLYYSDINSISNNTLSNNSYGITLKYSDNDTIIYNIFTYNVQYGINVTWGFVPPPVPHPYPIRLNYIKSFAFFQNL